MKAKIEGNLVTLVTDIPAAYAGRNMVAKDEEGNEKFRIEKSNRPGISNFGVSCNTATDGFLAVAFFTEEEMSQEDFKDLFGAAVINLKKYQSVILANLQEEDQEVNDAFADLFA